MKKETYPEYVRRKDAEKPGHAAKRAAGKALAKKKLSRAASVSSSKEQP